MAERTHASAARESHVCSDTSSLLTFTFDFSHKMTHNMGNSKTPTAAVPHWKSSVDDDLTNPSCWAEFCWRWRFYYNSGSISSSVVAFCIVLYDNLSDRLTEFLTLSCLVFSHYHCWITGSFEWVEWLNDVIIKTIRMFRYVGTCKLVSLFIFIALVWKGDQIHQFMEALAKPLISIRENFHTSFLEMTLGRTNLDWWDGRLDGCLHT